MDIKPCDGTQNQHGKTPRAYQVELLEKAKQDNSIIFLGTGSGKTFIATMLIKHYMDKMIRDGMKTVFLVPSVPLVDQQTTFIKENTTLNVQSFCGADGVDYWDTKKWKDKIDNNDVLVMIHQVLLDAMDHGYFKMSDVCLIIVDECHHAVKNSPYVQIFKNHYHKLKDEHPCPRVLALSASIVPSKETKEGFLQKKVELEKILDSKVITTSNLDDLLKYATNPLEEVVIYDPIPDLARGITNICEVFSERMKEIQAQHLVNNKSGNVVDDGNMKDRANSKFRKYRKYIVSFSTGIQMLGLYSGKSLADPLRTTIQNEIKECNEKYEEDMATAVLEYLDETERMIANIMGDCSELYRNCTGKVLTLMNILACPSKEGDFREQMVGIVFVKERIVASSLAFIISEFVKIYPEKIGHIKVDWAVGGTSSKAYKMPAAQKMIENNQARDKLKIKLDKFRRGEINLMVATEVLEEGLDITKCNLVIRFDDVPNFRAFVQSKGRARAREESIGLHSRYIILAENSRENLEKLKKDLRDYKNLENSAIDLCHGSSGTEEEDKDDSDDDAYYANPNDQVNSARITKNSAVTIINSFVQNIPTDRYTILAPYFQCRKMPNPNQSGPDVEYRSVLHMPHKTPYSGIPFYGPRCSEATRAKQKVAILACKRLHKDGLLGNDLLPKRKKFDSSEESSDDDMSNKKRGTKSFKEYYPVSLASQFDFDYEAKNFYLYRINTELVEKALDTRNPPYVPELHSAKMGILVSQELPPIFLSTNHFYSLSGKLSTAFENCGTFYLSTHEKYEILAFHDYVFEKVIGCKNSWTWPDLDSKGAMIIPINAQKMIDFNQITKVVSYRHQNTSKIKSTPNRFIYNANDYINTVVTPNHKQPEEHYFVEEVMKNTNPNTILDGNTNITFEKYYKDKYDSMVTSLEQELLRVSGADHRHFMYSKVANKKTEKTRSVIRDQIFMPELVDVEPLLASLWREAQLIPFLMERLTHLSRIEDYRKLVCNEFNIPYDISLTEDTRQTSFENLIKKSNGVVNHIPTSRELLIAFTLASAGEEFNMERLEVLGDVFLKFSIGVRVFCSSFTNMLAGEGTMSQERSKLVGNRNLFKQARKEKQNFSQIVSARKLEPYLNFMAPKLRQKEGLEEVICEMDEIFSYKARKNDNRKSGSELHVNTSKSIVDLLTKQDIERLSNNGMDPGTQEELTEKALVNANDEQFSLNRNSRYRLRQFVRIGDKYLADVVEALIGSFLENCGPPGALMFMKFLELDNKGALLEADLPPNAFLPHCIGKNKEQSTLEKMEKLLLEINSTELEKKLGYEFTNKSFLLQAMTHASYSANTITQSYEILEFLGDGILDYLITSYIYTKGQKHCETPGEITEMRSALVQNNAFASVVLRNQLENHLLHKSPSLLRKIDECRNHLLEPMPDQRSDWEEPSSSTTSQKDEEVMVKGADKLLKDLQRINETECPVLENIEVPKVLGDILEAIIGAVYIDSGMSLPVAWSVYTKLFSEAEINEVIRKKPTHPVKELMERYPNNVKFMNSKVLKDGGISIVVEVAVNKESGNRPLKFTGLGRNTIGAKYASAKCALREFEKNVYRDTMFNARSNKNSCKEPNFFETPLEICSFLDLESKPRRPKLPLQSTGDPSIALLQLKDYCTPPISSSLDMHPESKPRYRLDPQMSKVNTQIAEDTSSLNYSRLFKRINDRYPNDLGPTNTQMLVPFNAIYKLSDSSKNYNLLPSQPKIGFRSKQSDKNPIMQLQELCVERAWPMPGYNLVKEDGPPHMKRFLFEVKVNYKTYQSPEEGLERGKKQDAKAAAAGYALSKLLN